MCTSTLHQIDDFSKQQHHDFMDSFKFLKNLWESKSSSSNNSQSSAHHHPMIKNYHGSTYHLSSSTSPQPKTPLTSYPMYHSVITTTTNGKGNSLFYPDPVKYSFYEEASPSSISRYTKRKLLPNGNSNERRQLLNRDQSAHYTNEHSHQRLANGYDYQSLYGGNGAEARKTHSGNNGYTSSQLLSNTYNSNNRQNDEAKNNDYHGHQFYQSIFDRTFNGGCNQNNKGVNNTVGPSFLAKKKTFANSKKPANLSDKSAHFLNLSSLNDEPREIRSNGFGINTDNIYTKNPSSLNYGLDALDYDKNKSTAKTYLFGNDLSSNNINNNNYTDSYSQSRSKSKVLSGDYYPSGGDVSLTSTLLPSLTEHKATTVGYSSNNTLDSSNQTNNRISSYLAKTDPLVTSKSTFYHPAKSSSERLTNAFTKMDNFKSDSIKFYDKYKYLPSTLKTSSLSVSKPAPYDNTNSSPLKAGTRNSRSLLAMDASIRNKTTLLSSSVNTNFPVTPKDALKLYAHYLSPYEHKEILKYEDIWYMGKINRSSRQQLPMRSSTTLGASLDSGYAEDDKDSNGTNTSMISKDRKGTVDSNAKSSGYTTEHNIDLNSSCSTHTDKEGLYKIVVSDHIAYRYEIIDVLGQGSFSQVVKVYDHKEKKYFALKIIRNKKRFHQQALTEIKLLKNLQSSPYAKGLDQTVKMIDHFYFRQHLCIIFELLGPSLYDMLKKTNFRGFRLELVRDITRSLLKCLSTLRKHRIIHCDFKPENILVKPHTKFDVKLIDFGSSCYESEQIYTYIQSRFYRSPEIILGLTKYGPAIDLWSLGCVAAELFSGFPLFPGEDEKDQLSCFVEILGTPTAKDFAHSCERWSDFFDVKNNLRCNKRSYRQPNSKNLSSALKCDEYLFIDFLYKCFRWNPKERITPREALAHPWITGEIIDEKEYFKKSGVNEAASQKTTKSAYREIKESAGIKFDVNNSKYKVTTSRFGDLLTKYCGDSHDSGRSSYDKKYKDSATISSLYGTLGGYSQDLLNFDTKTSKTGAANTNIARSYFNYSTKPYNTTTRAMRDIPASSIGSRLMPSERITHCRQESDIVDKSKATTQNTGGVSTLLYKSCYDMSSLPTSSSSLNIKTLSPVKAKTRMNYVSNFTSSDASPLKLRGNRKNRLTKAEDTEPTADPKPLNVDEEVFAEQSESVFTNGTTAAKLSRKYRNKPTASPVSALPPMPMPVLSCKIQQLTLDSTSNALSNAKGLPANEI